NLNKEYLERGWTMQGDVAISPSIDESLVIPYDQFDEWYLLDSPQSLGEKVEVFVNYGSFTLVSPPIYEAYRPTWEKSGLEWLAPAQERFWHQLQQIRPVTYVASGDNDVIASRDGRFIAAVRDATSPPPG